MIEMTIIKYLSDKLDVPVSAERPETPPKSYVIVEKTSGGITDHIETSTIAIQSYADTLYNAAFLNETVKTCMENASSLDEVGRVKLNSDYNYTNTMTKDYRYQSVYDITHY